MSKNSKEYLANMHREAFENKKLSDEEQIKDALDRYYLNKYKSRINMFFYDNETIFIKKQVEYCVKRGKTTFTIFIRLVYNDGIYVRTDCLGSWILVRFREWESGMPSPLKDIIYEKKLYKLNVISKEYIKNCISYFKFHLKEYGFDVVDVKYPEYFHIIDKKYDKLVASKNNFFDKEIVIPIEVSF